MANPPNMNGDKDLAAQKGANLNPGVARQSNTSRDSRKSLSDAEAPGMLDADSELEDDLEDDDADLEAADLEDEEIDIEEDEVDLEADDAVMDEDIVSARNEGMTGGKTKPVNKTKGKGGSCGC